jgi:outer membrane protein OmpA-like peptidoglycan-associated protein
MSKLSILIGGLTLWGTMLAFFCLPHDGHHIQQDIASRSAALLAERNVSTGSLENTISVDGRDVTLSGYEGSPEVSDQTVKLVAALWGVRSVHTNILHRPALPRPVVTQEQANDAAASISGILKLQNVEFYSGSDRLTPLGEQTLGKVSKVLQRYPGMPVQIEGHTDSQGNPNANLELSRKRAASVKHYLLAQGIPGANLTDVGFGDTKPAASNRTAVGRQQNRRVEFHTKEIN